MRHRPPTGERAFLWFGSLDFTSATKASASTKISRIYFVASPGLVSSRRKSSFRAEKYLLFVAIKVLVYIAGEVFWAALDI